MNEKIKELSQFEDEHLNDAEIGQKAGYIANHLKAYKKYPVPKSAGDGVFFILPRPQRTLKSF